MWDIAVPSSIGAAIRAAESRTKGWIAMISVFFTGLCIALFFTLNLQDWLFAQTGYKISEYGIAFLLSLFGSPFVIKAHDLIDSYKINKKWGG